MKRILLLPFLLILAMGALNAWAETAQLVVNELKVFTVEDVKRVAVGDPAIADVTVLSESELMVVGKKAGVTSLIIWDVQGQRSFTLTVIEQDTENLAAQIRELLTSSQISGVKVRTEKDQIYVIGDVLTQNEADKVGDILAAFSGTVNLVKLRERQPLIEIEINVLEVAYDDQKNLGMDWSNTLPLQHVESSTNRTDAKLTNIWRVLRWNRDAIDARLNLLIQENKARTLANPKLVTVSGKEASFLVGGEIPYITVETEGRTRVEWKDYGVTLKVLPLINSKNEIKTSIEAEVSDLDAARTVTYEGYNIPAIKTRKAQTELFLNEGDTIFLAGLIKNEDSRNIDRLPWLSKVPILGELFKSKEFKDKRTELVISIRPKVLGERADSEYLAEKLREQEKDLTKKSELITYDEASSPIVYYSHMVEDMITRGVVYPSQAYQAQVEGVVKIELCLLSNGQLKNASIQKSSGFSVLDQAALSAVKDIAPYPSFPTQLDQEELLLSVPVVFRTYAKNE